MFFSYYFAFLLSCHCLRVLSGTQRIPAAVISVRSAQKKALVCLNLLRFLRLLVWLLMSIRFRFLTLLGFLLLLIFVFFGNCSFGRVAIWFPGTFGWLFAAISCHFGPKLLEVPDGEDAKSQKKFKLRVCHLCPPTLCLQARGVPQSLLSILQQWPWSTLGADGWWKLVKSNYRSFGEHSTWLAENILL